MPNQEAITKFWDAHAVPWGINIVAAIAIFVIGKIVVGILVNIAKRLMRKAGADEILAKFAGSIINAGLMLFVIVAALDRLGIDTTSMVALLGAAGLAVGLSLQDSLKNFAAGAMLLVFRPFKAGDFVEAGGTAGIVETIQIFTTTIRTGDNKEVIVPNGAIYGSNIVNYSARDTRRVDMVFGIAYDADIRKAKEIFQEILEADERILKDPAPVIAVSELADSSVNFVVRPWVKTADYWAVLWATTESVKLRLDEAGIGIPFPQIEMHLNKPE